MNNILVFFGGKSVEHDISIITGVLCANSLDKLKYNPIPIYISKEGEWLSGDELFNVENFKENSFKSLKRVTLLGGDDTLYSVCKNKLKPICRAYASISCMHGINGEDGGIIGALKMSNIAICSPDLFASSTFIDKDFTKIFLTGIGAPKLPYVRIFRNAFYEKKQTAVKMVEKKFSYPVIVKPANLGSSIGIKTANDGKELLLALSSAFLYDDKVIVEEKLVGFREINCACYKSGDKILVSECEEPITANQILSFDDKYLGYKTGSNRNMPANIQVEMRDKIRAITEKIYRKADMHGIVRIDYIVYEGKIYVNEVNTVPGSLAYYLFADTISKFSSLLTSLIEEGVKISQALNRRKLIYASSVLKSIKGVKGGKVKAFDKK